VNAPVTAGPQARLTPLARRALTGARRGAGRRRGLPDLARAGVAFGLLVPVLALVPGHGADDLEGLTPQTRQAYLDGQREAAAAGVTMRLTSGHRTAAEQQELFDAEVRERGGVEAARRWVLPPAESQHVRGTALDILPRPAAAWLRSEGARFGLCQTYSWEHWHFEYREEWKRTGSCPAPR
jgi:D-alanyl-D-alanine carboxypeptidase